MQKIPETIATERLLLRTWRNEDLSEFARLHADSSVMHDLGGPISEDKSRAKLTEYMSMYDHFGFSRYCVEDRTGRFVGYVGICPRADEQPIGPHIEIGWRLNTAFWGRGYATEAARVCLTEFCRLFPGREVVTYTTAENIRSQNVMARLKTERVPARDFQWTMPDGTSIPMLVWVANQNQ